MLKNFSSRVWLLCLVSLSTSAGAFGQEIDLLGQGQKAFDRGAFSQAAADWEKAVESFRSRGKTNEEIQALTSLAGAYQAIGQQRLAVDRLRDALARAEKLGNPRGVGWAKAKLGQALIMLRKPDEAAQLLQEALHSARDAKDDTLAAAVLNDQGTALAFEQKHAEAVAAFQESAALARATGNSLLAAQALCNAAATSARAGQNVKAEELNGQALQEIARLEKGHQKGFLLLTAGQTDRQIKLADAEAGKRLLLRAHHSLEAAMELGDQLKDDTTRTYALGFLGQAYEQDGQPEPALALTRRASFVAQQAQMDRALYRWQWQLGRLLKAQGQISEALIAYRSAVQTLQPIRNDVSLGYGNAPAALSFREADGPIFFELADLLLRQAEAAKDQASSRELLIEARNTVEQLKAVELEDYFRDDCVDVQKAKTRAIEALDPRTAVIYYIALPTRLAVLVSLGADLKSFTVDVSADKLTAEVRDFRRNLETRTTYRYLGQARQLYDWLIRPLHELLKEKGVDTLVFVPDGALRTIPLGALQDGERFLIEDFAVAVTPGLSLLEPHPLGRDKARLLLNGLSQAVQGFPSLDYVPEELHSIGPMYRSKTLLNEGFTLEELQRRMTEEQYSIVHIASHGQFNKDAPKTFVLTYDGKLTLNALEALIRPGKYRGLPVELLVLSACQTAAGDDRAALGLAGVAVKAGARSALATLWFVNDESTSALTSEVYAQLRHSPEVTKARALQAAQIKLLHDRRYRHPCYWSPFLMIGNWL